MSLGVNLRKCRESKGLTQKEMSDILDISKSNISKYESGDVEPNIDTLIKYADYFRVSIDYLLDRGSYDATAVAELLGYEGRDESAITFQNKLANQIDFSGTKIGDLASALGIDEKVILDWLTEKDDSYPKYYKSLSDYFKVSERYWTSPNAISPGIEPNMEEYLLILMKRDYAASGTLNDAYGDLSDYFPGLVITSDPEEQELLAAYRKMNRDSKDIVKGKAKEVLRTQHYDEINEAALNLPKASGK
ncbi:MAG: helix-turn-helix transcriptional regulator [Eubacterium sp.]|nr:helix-turn-helix transcriptional regulator [Eubacterium sp.]